MTTYTTSIKDVDQEVNTLRCQFQAVGSTFAFCVYHVDGLLIDTGPPRAPHIVEPFVQNHSPQKIFITHHHEDHLGNAKRFQDQYQIPVYMSEATNQTISSIKDIPFYRRMVWGNPQWPEAQIIQKEICTEKYCFQMIPTPGHCSDHHVLFEEQNGWLFAGDLYIGTHLKTGFRGEYVMDMIQSIESLLNLPITTLFCGHAGIISNGKTALSKKLDFLNRLVNDVRQLQKKGYSAHQVTSKLFRRNWFAESFSFGGMSPFHLVNSIYREII
ncbi:MBL fold metallo-hydrolase [Hazenella sp. IB182357]|uniref:MBL fold metallo-hydrolase n=1 Tax=Polycladospora coralii TaxID=2771432 RepID=A0A926RUR7_9BACL|nr:MBL fold metallo-hydrolase [Polycladospora coralii]MBD1373318.1 MBL fold metallo-hydrolase [Polycladospora coralii]